MTDDRTIIHPITKKLKRLPIDEEIKKANVHWTKTGISPKKEKEKKEIDF